MSFYFIGAEYQPNVPTNAILIKCHVITYSGTPLLRPPNRLGQSGLNGRVVLIVKLKKKKEGERERRGRESKGERVRQIE